MPIDFDDIPRALDDGLVSIRRKRRSSSSPRPLESINTESAQGILTNANDSGPCSAPAKTPSKTKKRVRFSDPGPESPARDFSAPPSSTGLTPHLSRTSFSTRARDARDSSPPSRPQARRRLSQPPPILTNSSSPIYMSSSISPSSPMPQSGLVQFARFGQVLDARAKRRIRRNRLSEVQNAPSKMTKAQMQQEMEDLRVQLAAEKGAKISGSLDGSGDKELRIHQLEQELSQLKQEPNDHSEQWNIPGEALGHTKSGIYVDDTAEDFVEQYVDDSNALQERLPPDDVAEPLTHAAADKSQVVQDVKPVVDKLTTIHASTQADLTIQSDPAVLRDARLSLEYLFPGEIALGLVPEDPKPLLDLMLDRLRTLKAQILVTEDALSTNQMQESNLRTQFNAVLEQLDRSRKYAEKVAGRYTGEKQRADSAHAQLAALEGNASESNEEMETLRQQCKEKDRSLSKLQAALDSYRIETGKLEELINRIEAEHKATVDNLRAEMDEAVADLEVHATAEAAGRREAESTVEDLNQAITNHRSREEELLKSISEKERSIESLDAALIKEQSSHHHESGMFNVRIGNLTNELADVRSDLKKSQADRLRAEQGLELLAATFQKERDANERTITALQASKAQYCTSTDDICLAHATESKRLSAEAAEHKGLLTPITATRFKDAETEMEFHDEGAADSKRDYSSECGEVPGYVELERGHEEVGRKRIRLRKRPDSGIGVLAEDEDEDMFTAM